MPEFQIIKNIVEKNVTIKKKKIKTYSCARQKKRKPNCPYYIKLEEGRYKVKIHEVPERSIAIKADLFPIQQNVIKCTNNRGICQCADYILISVDKRCIFFIELKGPDDKDLNGAKKKTFPVLDGLKEKIEGQLKGAKCLMHYYTQIGKEFFYDNFLNNYEFRYIAIIATTRPITTHPNRSSDGDSPSNFSIIYSKGGTIPFNQLVGMAP